MAASQSLKHGWKFGPRSKITEFPSVYPWWVVSSVQIQCAFLWFPSNHLESPADVRKLICLRIKPKEQPTSKGLWFPLSFPNTLRKMNYMISAQRSLPGADRLVDDSRSQEETHSTAGRATENQGMSLIGYVAKKGTLTKQTGAHTHTNTHTHHARTDARNRRYTHTETLQNVNDPSAPSKRAM